MTLFVLQKCLSTVYVKLMFLWIHPKTALSEALVIHVHRFGMSSHVDSEWSLTHLFREVSSARCMYNYWCPHRNTTNIDQHISYITCRSTVSKIINKYLFCIFSPTLTYDSWHRSGGRLCTRFLGSQVHADGVGQGRKGNGLVCTRGQGPHLYTRPRASSVHAEWFCCMYTFVLTAVYFVWSMCAGCQVHNNAFWTCVKYVPKHSIP